MRGNNSSSATEPGDTWEVESSELAISTIVADDAWNMRGRGKVGLGIVAVARAWCERQRERIAVGERASWQESEMLHDAELPLSLIELRDSIRSVGRASGVVGKLAPVAVYYQDGTPYLCAGFRRYAASLLAYPDDHASMMIDVRVVPREHARETNLLENLHRDNPSPPECAEGIAALREEYDYTAAECAAKLARSRKYVEALLRLRKGLSREVWAAWLAEPHRWSRNYLEAVILPLGKSEQWKALTAPKVATPRGAPKNTEKRIQLLKSRIARLLRGESVGGFSDNWTQQERRVFAHGAKWADDTYNLV
jgi:ParB/RepB/Spo0J family partition protein